MSSSVTCEGIIKNKLLDLGIDPKGISKDTRIKSELGLDSVEIVEVLVALHKFYNFDIKDLTNMDDPTLDEVYKMIGGIK